MKLMLNTGIETYQFNQIATWVGFSRPNKEPVVNCFGDVLPARICAQANMTALERNLSVLTARMAQLTTQVQPLLDASWHRILTVAYSQSFRPDEKSTSSPHASQKGPFFTRAPSKDSGSKDLDITGGII